MFFEIIGFLICVIFGTAITIMTGVMLFFGGGDCGPLFGNWRHEGALPTFFFLLVITVLTWWGIYNWCPFTLTLAVK